MDTTRASLLMVAAMALFAVEDALIKEVSASVPVGQILLVIGGAGALILGLAARVQGIRVVTRQAFSPAMLLRSGAEFAGTIGFVTALSLIPISTASAILQAVPLVVTIGAALFLRERVGWRRWLAVTVGLAGVLVILRPGAEGFDANALWAVLGVLGLAVRDLATRRVPAGMPTLQLSCWGFFALVPAGTLLLLLGEPPVPVDGTEALLLLGSLSLGLVGYSAMTLATRTGDLSAVAPFRYTRLLFALAIGAVVFGERPDLTTLAGAALVVGSGIYTLLREAKVRRMTRRAQPVPGAVGTAPSPLLHPPL